MHASIDRPVPPNTPRLDIIHTHIQPTPHATTQNELLFLENYVPERDQPRFHFVAHAALDVFEERRRESPFPSPCTCIRSIDRARVAVADRTCVHNTRIHAYTLPTVKRPGTGAGAAPAPASSGGAADMYLGYLCPIEEFRLYVLLRECLCGLLALPCMRFLGSGFSYVFLVDSVGGDGGIGVGPRLAMLAAHTRFPVLIVCAGTGTRRARR